LAKNKKAKELLIDFCLTPPLLPKAYACPKFLAPFRGKNGHLLSLLFLEPV
jgi:hypothetical protein